MSMHWEGYSELGLILTEENLDVFRENYLKAHTDISEDDFEDMLFDREQFVSKDDTKTFDLLYLTDDCIEGVTLLSLNGNGWWRQELPAVIVLSSIGDSAWSIFENGFYESKKDLIAEIKSKVGGYLPEDFDYDECIGNVTYACYA